MNIMIDTNVILDDILNRGSNADTAQKISRLATDNLVKCYITANSITDIFYIVSKSLNEIAARKIIRNLLLSFDVVGVDGEDCRLAIDLPMGDFEDALVVVCAEKAALDYIVTNDKGFLSDMSLSVPAINPINFLSKIET